MRKLIGYAGIAGLGMIVVLGFLAYFVTSVDQPGSVRYDGLGRPLSNSPLFMRMFFGQEREWVGWSWFFVDMMVFWGGGLLFFRLWDWGFGNGERTAEELSPSNSIGEKAQHRNFPVH